MCVRERPLVGMGGEREEFDAFATDTEVAFLAAEMLSACSSREKISAI